MDEPVSVDDGTGGFTRWLILGEVIASIPRRITVAMLKVQQHQDKPEAGPDASGRDRRRWRRSH
jgi:hypothetical protein